MPYRNIFTYINKKSLDGFYHLSTKKGSLSSSREYCNALDNSLLPVVKSKGQTTALADFVKSKSTGQLYTYIGLTAIGKYKGYNNPEGVFHWEDGSKDFDLENNCNNALSCIWSTGHPTEGSGFCLNPFGRINSVSSGKSTKAICEKRSMLIAISAHLLLLTFIDDVKKKLFLISSLFFVMSLFVFISYTLYLYDFFLALFFVIYFGLFLK